MIGSNGVFSPVKAMSFLFISCRKGEFAFMKIMTTKLVLCSTSNQNSFIFWFPPSHFCWQTRSLCSSSFISPSWTSFDATQARLEHVPNPSCLLVLGVVCSLAGSLWSSLSSTPYSSKSTLSELSSLMLLWLLVWGKWRLE